MSNLAFVPSVPSASGKTKTWSVSSTFNGSYLGTVRWYAPWRKYCFFPKGGDTVFDQGCLAEVCDFLRTETQCHIAERA